MVGEFSLDNEDSALSRLVGRVEQAQGQISAQFSLDNPESGLTRIVQRLEQLRACADRARARFELACLDPARAARHAAATTRAAPPCTATTSSSASASSCRRIALPRATSSTPSATRSGVISRCKIGDFVVTLGPDSAGAGAAIVVEAKASGAYTLKATLDEADEARRNRAASVCLFVHSARTAPAGLPELAR